MKRCCYCRQPIRGPRATQNHVRFCSNRCGVKWHTGVLLYKRMKSRKDTVFEKRYGGHE